jgi:hypothetical protein
MKLANLLAEKKSPIVAHWLKLLYDGYPPETAIFLKKEKDKFDNPVGYRISQGLTGLYEALLQGSDTGEIHSHLDEIIRIRALQNCTPAQALAFVFLLKNVLRQELAKELKDLNLAAELLEMESRIDGLALLGFDVYTQRRERLNEVRVKEIKNRVSGLMRKSGLSMEDLEQEGHDQRST